MTCKGGFLLANNESCTYKEGPLPNCAPLALGTIPMQTAAKPAYDSDEALAKGTLFPGLDLPFMDYAASGMRYETPQNELMALDFVTQELALYLDTHPSDMEAFELWKCFTELAAEGRKRYVERYGPIARSDTALFDKWVWSNNDWPWHYTENGGKR